MKKALIVLLILAVAGGVFAQSFSGNVRTGLWFTFDGEDNPVVAYSDDTWDPAAVRANVNFSNGGDDWGISVSTWADVPVEGDARNGPNVANLKGWVKFADIFKLSAGREIDDPWQTPGPEWEPLTYNSGLANVVLEITPISGLNFGFRLTYPNNGTKANKLVNFFEETGIGATYDAGIFSAATSLDLSSEESNGAGLDATWRFGVNVPTSIVNFAFQGAVNNLTEKAGKNQIWFAEEISGNIVGLNWRVNSKQTVVPDFAVDYISPRVTYGIPINDKASAEVGAEATFSFGDEFSFDAWYGYARGTYDFNDKVWTYAEFGLDDGQRNWNGGARYSKMNPYLMWAVGYSF